MNHKFSLMSLHNLSLAATVAALCLVFASDANAQPGGGRGGMGMFGGRGGAQLLSSLVTMEEVQKELGLSDKQVEEIVGPATQLNDDLRAEMREIMQGGGDQGEIADLVKEMKEQEGELLKKLNADQMKRLQQLNYQRMGIGMVMDEGAQKELKITDAQKKGIEEAMASMRESMQEMFQGGGGGGGDREAMREKMQEAQTKMQETIEGLLTDKQKEMMEEMKGAAFEFPQRQGRQGGRRSDF
jgi:hypothetical protein